MRWRSISLACVIFPFLAGCAGVQVAEYRASRPEGLPDRVELQNVPFYPQAQYQCGPAALAMALTDAGVFRTPSDLTEQVFLPRRDGSLQPEMLAATRRAGLLAYTLAPEPGALLRELAAKHPVVALLNLRYDFFPQWHYMVLIGYDLTSEEMVLRSGVNGRMVMKLDDFDRSWAKAQRWAFVALPPDQVPATANESAYVDAAIALERVAPESARVAYATALARWPDNLIARMGLGNAAYRQHQQAIAEMEYRRAAADHPDAADAWNNLAQVLHEQERNPEAMEAADRAVAIGGPRQTIYESTREAIKAAIAH